MDSVLQFFRNLGAVRLAVMAGVTAALVGFFAWIFSEVTAPQFGLLYADLDVSDSAQIAAKLESEQIPYDLRNGGQAIYVPVELVARSRVRLAGHGLPAGGSIGYELFDKGDAFGASNFMQNVNLVRALEGELARTIRSIDGVQSTRVHLVLPKRELFSRQREEPSASVVLQMQGAKRLSHSQVLAVQHLVASAVPALTPDRISVIDDKGTLLAGGFESRGGAQALNQKAEQQRLDLENHLARTIERLLERTVGPGKVRAEVFANMDFDRINTSEEIFDPEGQVVRSTQTVAEAAKNRDGSTEPPVSVATNLPDTQLTPAEGEGSESDESRTEETVNYEISKKVVNHVREAGIVNRLSVAVLVDGTYAAAGDGTLSYQPRSTEELNLLATLVRGAVGFNASRGDTVEVINMRFAELEAAGEVEPSLAFGLTKHDLLKLGQYLVLIVFAVLVLLLVIRPLVARLLEAIPAPVEPANALFGPQAAAPALAGPSGGLPALREPGSQGEDLEEMIDLDRVEGRVRASTVKKVGEIVERHPEEVLSILRSWLHNNP
jgi:flagellar M-ring protein FliF